MPPRKVVEERRRWGELLTGPDYIQLIRFGRRPSREEGRKSMSLPLGHVIQFRISVNFKII